MARDPGLEALIEDHLRPQSGISETRMFGGRAWLLNRNLLCCARHDGMLTRLGKGQDGWALELDDVGPMCSGERVMQGWVRVGPAAFGDDALRQRLLDAALAFVRTLPPK